ncbi:MAG TPA: TonB-dependent receptor [Bryobacteraceae bacterium]|nr:TonB-dependent receptor [Bryobacteraceae bacterium]
MPASKLGLLFLFAALAAHAQNSSGTLSGLVKDTSNAVIPKAQLTIINENTGLRRMVETNEDGTFRVPFLPVGMYSVQVQKDGFRSEIQKSIQLEILQVRTVDFTLQVGAVSEAITVQTDAPLLDAESSQSGEVIKTEQVTNLPLGRRNFMQLAFLAPMATPATRDFRTTEIGRGSSVPSTAGQRPEQNNYQIDGIDNRDSGRASYAISPPVDSITEFRVQTGMAPAEFGKGGGTIINVVTKSGTNQYHGTLYEFVRNDLFDARNYFASSKSPLKLNQFGGAIGAPLRKDKLFFFGNYEGLRQRTAGQPPLYRVFSDTERSGVFAVPVRDPISGVPFPNNTIPQSQISPISQRILQLVPRANRPDPARNYLFENRKPAVIGTNNVVSRADYNAGVKDTLYGRYIYNAENYVSSAAWPEPTNAGGTDLTLRAQTASAHWNHIVRPTLINSFSLGYTRYRNLLATLNSFKQDFVQPIGITNTVSYVDPLFWGMPNFTVTGYNLPGDPTPNYRTTNSYQMQESLFWSRGSHNVKIGGDLRDIREHMFYTGGNSSHAFANRYSGDFASDFLLGLPSSVSKTARGTIWSSRLHYLGVFAQDDWKVTPRLTLNLGIRYEVESAIKQADDGGLGFDLASGSMLVSKYIKTRPFVEPFYKDIRPDLPIRFVENRAPYDADTNNLGIRFGFAYRARRNTVVRGGYGIFYDSPQIPSLASTNDFAPNTLRPIWTGNPTRPDLSFNPEGNVSAEASLRTAPLTVFPFLSRNFPYGKIQQWLFSLQQQITPTLVIEGLYQGSNGVSLLAFDNWNARLPGPGVVQNLLPFPGLARIQAEVMNARSWYHGGAIKAEQRFSKGMSYLVAYTYSKSLDTASTLNAGPQWTDPTRRLETAKGPSDFDARNRFSAAFEYQLPFGRNRALLKNLGAADRLISGWGARGTVFFQTGDLVSPAMNLARVGICATACTARPDRVGSGNLSKDERTLDRFFDINAFQLLQNGGLDRRVGNGGRNILYQPGIKNHDLQIFKNTRLFENHTLEFRWEMYNAWNHANWGGASANLEVPATFGKILSRGGTRTMQFALRYDF